MYLLANHNVNGPQTHWIIQFKIHYVDCNTCIIYVMVNFHFHWNAYILQLVSMIKMETSDWINFILSFNYRKYI